MIPMLTVTDISKGMRILADNDPRFNNLLSEHGSPPPRSYKTGFSTLFNTIVSQQVSTAAALSIWKKLEAEIGSLDDPQVVLDTPTEILRGCGLSRQKVEYARSLSLHVLQGDLPLDSLPADDEEAIRLLTAVKGLGRWSAENYLLFAEGRPDIFPAGDLALQIQAGKVFFGGERPTERQLRHLSSEWQPHRSIAALFLWHCYAIRTP